MRDRGGRLVWAAPFPVRGGTLQYMRWGAQQARILERLLWLKGPVPALCPA